MLVIQSNTADSAWRRAVDQLKCSEEVKRQRVRGQWTRELLHVLFEINDPRQRWVTSRRPAINLPFALAEVAWIMAGRNDAAFLSFWNRAYKNFAGPASHYHGAYGFRLRRQLGFDQLDRAYLALSNNPSTRQIVLQVWHSDLDLPTESGSARDPDIPCNICSLLKVRDSRLDWFQIIRSNDIFLGFPYNVVQWTFIQEAIAGWLGLELGLYCQLSDSLHLYERDEPTLSVTAVDGEENTDSIGLPKEDADKAWSTLIDETERLASPDLSKRDVFGLLIGIKGFDNIAFILRAEAARRRGWNDEASEILARCSNNVYVEMWNRWIHRMSKPR